MDRQNGRPALHILELTVLNCPFDTLNHLDTTTNSLGISNETTVR
jgi:hypothetical protein